MPGCQNIEIIDGGTIQNTTVTNSNITNSAITNSTLSNVALTDNITLDAAVAEDLASALCPLIADCLDFPAEEVAAVFKDCNGAAHVPNTNIPTCAQMNTAIQNAIAFPIAIASPNTTDGSPLPTTIAGNDRTMLLGKPNAWLKVGNFIIPAYTIA